MPRTYVLPGQTTCKLWDLLQSVAALGPNATLRRKSSDPSQAAFFPCTYATSLPTRSRSTHRFIQTHVRIGKTDSHASVDGWLSIAG